MWSCRTAGHPEAQIPVLAFSNLWANHLTSLSLFPGAVKNVYQLFKRRFRDVSNESEIEHLPAPSVVLRDLGNRTDFCVKMSTDILQWNAKSR